MKLFIAFLSAIILISCSAPPLPSKELKPVARDVDGNYHYRLAPSDVVSIFVWRNQDISGDYMIRPDGQLNMALTTPVIAEGLTTSELEAVLQESLSELIKSPRVTVVMRQALGNSHEQVRIVGSASQPYATPYRKGMTLLDLITQSGGISPYASGNRAELIRTHHGVANRYSLRIDDLLNKADLTANVELQPGDIVRIPQAFF